MSHHARQIALSLALERERTARTHPRHLFQWKTSIVFDHMDDRPTFRGVTLDISMGGASVVTGHNIYTARDVIVLVAIPPLARGLRNQVVEIKSRMAYTVLSGETDSFRVGLMWRSFERNGREVLDAALKARS